MEYFILIKIFIEISIILIAAFIYKSNIKRNFKKVLYGILAANALILMFIKFDFIHSEKRVKQEQGIVKERMESSMTIPKKQVAEFNHSKALKKFDKEFSEVQDKIHKEVTK